MFTKDDFFDRPVRIQVSDLILNRLEEASLQKDTDEYVSTQYFLNVVNRYVSMNLFTLELKVLPNLLRKLCGHLMPNQHDLNQGCSQLDSDLFITHSSQQPCS